MTKEGEGMMWDPMLDGLTDREKYHVIEHIMNDDYQLAINILSQCIKKDANG